MQLEKIVLNEARNVKLTCFVQDVGGEFGAIQKRPAILILPGGGYSMCSDREAEPIAYAYLKAGFQAFVLRYSVGEHKAWPNPLNDYDAAMALLLENAESWHIQTDKIAVIGFSAGGHLTACAATVAMHRPAAAILGYPAICKNLVDMCQPGMPYPAEHVSGDTCPCFLFTARDDNMAPTENNLEFETALNAHNIQFESHIYAYGGHGFSTGEPYLNSGTLCSRAARWVQDSIEWLWDIFGVLMPAGFAAPACMGKINGDMEPALSVECTIGYLRAQSDDVQALLHEVISGVKRIAAARYFSEDKLLHAVRGTRLCDLMKTLELPQSSIDQLDAALKKIPNKQ
ncbi:MAG TPA: alpha/beta hydrolase [Clostridiales bacterium]|nr:alpha/beta hydrolase [Clostridiales bacterium]